MSPSPSTNTAEYSDSKRSLIIGLVVGLGSLTIIVAIIVAFLVYGVHFHKKGSQDIPSGETSTEGSSNETSVDGRKVLKEGGPNSGDLLPSDQSSSVKDSGFASPKLDKVNLNLKLVPVDPSWL